MTAPGVAARSSSASASWARAAGSIASNLIVGSLHLATRPDARSRPQPRTANESLNARQLQARAEIDAATLQDREAQKAIEQYAAIRDVARQNVEVLLEAYDLGRTTLADLLTEQRRYLEVETGYTEVLGRAYDARVALRLARGDAR